MRTALYRPVGLAEFRLIAASGFTAFPPRLVGQPIFYPVLNQEYAREIARDWNTTDAMSGHLGVVLRFLVPTDRVVRYPIKVVGASRHEELWIPAEDLPAINAAILPPIEVLEAFFGSNFAGDRDEITAHLRPAGSAR